MGTESPRSQESRSFGNAENLLRRKVEVSAPRDHGQKIGKGKLRWDREFHRTGEMRHDMWERGKIHQEGGSTAPLGRLVENEEEKK